MQSTLDAFIKKDADNSLEDEPQSGPPVTHVLYAILKEYPK
jgi:hypothetical protein